MLHALPSSRFDATNLQTRWSMPAKHAIYNLCWEVCRSWITWPAYVASESGHRWYSTNSSIPWMIYTDLYNTDCFLYYRSVLSPFLYEICVNACWAGAHNRGPCAQTQKHSPNCFSEQEICIRLFQEWFLAVFLDVTAGYFVSLTILHHTWCLVCF